MARRRQPRTWQVEWADLSWPQVFELLWGPSGVCSCPRPDIGTFECEDPTSCTSAFESDEHRRAVFERHRTLLVEDRCWGGPNSGTRPWAWWWYVVGDIPPRDGQLARLVELDALHPDERAAILSRPGPVDGRPDESAALLRELTGT